MIGPFKYCYPYWKIHKIRIETLASQYLKLSDLVSPLNPSNFPVSPHSSGWFGWLVLCFVFFKKRDATRLFLFKQQVVSRGQLVVSMPACTTSGVPAVLR